MLKVNNKDTRRRQLRRSGVFIVNFDHISHLFSSVSIVNFELLNAGWVYCICVYCICILELPLSSSFSFSLPEIWTDWQKLFLYFLSIVAVGACDQYSTY